MLHFWAMTSEIDTLLARVAAGEVPPEQALARLEALGAVAPRTAGTAPVVAPEAPRPPAPAPRGPRGRAPDPARPSALHLRTSYRSIQVIGDDTVDQYLVAGAHTLRRDGAAIVVENPLGDDPDPDGPPPTGGRYRFDAVPVGLAFKARWRDEHLVIRVRPDLPIDVEVSGAHLRVAGLTGGTALRVLASAVRLDRVTGPFVLDATSSSVKGSFRPTGPSRIDCQSSSVKLGLLPGCHLRLEATNRLGKVLLPDTVSKGALTEATAVVGLGRDPFVIDATMSSVAVSVQR